MGHSEEYMEITLVLGQIRVTFINWVRTIIYNKYQNTIPASQQQIRTNITNIIQSGLKSEQPVMGHKDTYQQW